jgi:hypothetical protein
MFGLRFDRRRLRGTACMTLVAWMFALAAGVVNACALTPTGPESRGLGVRSAAEAASRQETAGEAEAHGRDGTHHGHSGNGGKQGCLKFCDDESSALSKNKASSFVADLPFSAVLALSIPILRVATAGNRPSIEWHLPQGPPLVIRLLRLTL